MKRVVCAIIAFVAVYVSSFSQVAVYPQALFLEPSSRSTTMTIMNTSEKAKEIIVELKYGYPCYDSLGHVAVNYKDTISSLKYSLAPYVKVFPKKLLLKAKEEQVVKLVLGNITDLSDGMYFTRVVVTSKDPQEQIDSTYGENEVQAKFDLRFSVVGALLFKKGNPNCKIDITGGAIANDTAGFRLNLNFERGGSSPFFGTTVIKAYDQSGNLVQETKEVSPVYFNCTKPFKFDEAKFKAGELYNFQIIMTNEHKDIPDAFKIPFEPYVHTVSAMVKSKR